MSIWFELMGFIAGCLTSPAFIPQIFRLIHEKKATGLSLSMFFVTFFGCFLWLIYGAVFGSVVLIVFNALNVVFTLIIMLLIKKYH